MALSEPWAWVQEFLTEDFDDVPTLLAIQDHARRKLGENVAMEVLLEEHPRLLSEWRIETATENAKCIEALRFITPRILDIRARRLREVVRDHG